MENIFNDPNLTETIRQFKLNCPVKKINMTLEEPNAIGGMYIISKPNGELELESKTEMDNVFKDTILFFTNQQIVEVMNFLYGILKLFEENNYIEKDNVINMIRDFMHFAQRIPTYDMLKLEITELLNKYIDTSSMPVQMSAKFCKVMIDVWFVSYATLDDIAKEAIESFKQATEQSKNEDKNE